MFWREHLTGTAATEVTHIAPENNDVLEGSSS